MGNVSIHKFRKSYQPYIYYTLIILIFSVICLLPIIKTTISIKSNGSIRPKNERTDIKSLISGFIDTIIVKEGDKVEQGQLLATIKDNNSKTKFILNEYELSQRKGFIHDLEILINSKDYSTILLATPLYRQQLNRFQFQVIDQYAAIKKVQKEQQINNLLISDKVIAPKEYFDKEIEAERLAAAFNAFKNEQLANWQNELQRYKLEVSQFAAQKKQIETDKSNFFLYAPVSGVVQNINTRYIGSFISSGEPLCIISPESTLIGECYVSTRDVGLLKVKQPVRFQLDAFDYNYFGILTGKTLSIDNDFTLIENKPVFKVRCSFDTTQLFLKNGYKGELKKGLTFQARFIVAERSLWQLLFDKVDDWFNPAAPSVPQTEMN